MTRRQQMQGFTLIEVLVAFVLVALGLMGLAALQVSTINNGFEAYQRAMVTTLVENMAERMRMNPEGSRMGLYAPFNSDATCLDSITTVEDRGARSETEIAAHDQCEWAKLIAGVAIKAPDVDATGISAPIGAMGCIETISATTTRVSVAWQGITAQTAPFATCGQGNFTNADPDNPSVDETFRRVIYRDVVVR